MYYFKAKEHAAGENFGDMVVVKLLRDNLVELNLIQLERYNMFRKSSFRPKLFCLKTLVSFLVLWFSVSVHQIALNPYKLTTKQPAAGENFNDLVNFN